MRLLRGGPVNGSQSHSGWQSLATQTDSHGGDLPGRMRSPRAEAHCFTITTTATSPQQQLIVARHGRAFEKVLHLTQRFD